jgi:hypothetical protein
MAMLNLSLKGAPIDDPQLAIFRALTTSPKALEAALLSAQPDAVDRPMNECRARTAPKGSPEAKALMESQRGLSGMTPLQWAVQFALDAEVRLLLRFGANPNLYNAGVTAVGLAGYVGSGRALAEFRAFGADLRLELRPEHAGPGMTAIGTTLLHRLGQRDSPHRAACARLLADCDRCYPDLSARCAQGRTIIDWSEGDDEDGSFRAAILAAMSEREQKALKKNTPASRASPKRRL